MKREKTLRQNLIFFLILALMLPMLCFAVLSQMRIWKVADDNMQESIDNDVRGMDTTLDLILDKYATVLYDFCTDEDIIHLVERINKKQDVLDTSSSQIRRELTHICNRHDGVEGITLITESGRVFFYDRTMASSHTSSWAGQVEAPKIRQGAVYRAVEESIPSDEGDINLYQICRKLVDYQDINRQVGTVILSINEMCIRDRHTVTHAGIPNLVRVMGQILAGPEKLPDALFKFLLVPIYDGGAQLALQIDRIFERGYGQGVNPLLADQGPGSKIQAPFPL